MHAQPTPNAEDALKRLMAGNRAFSAGQASRPRQAQQRRLDVAVGQTPFAAILGCSDSRVPPELVFDQGLGDLYVVRVAGNIADRLAIASLELAVEDLGVRLILVLGHDACAAVTRTIELLGLSAQQPQTGMWTWQHDWGSGPARPVGHLSELAAAIKPSVDEAHHRGRDRVDAAIDANIRRVVEQLKTSQPILASRVANAGLRVVGARYHLASGVVTLTS
jgi:carbonic anhydrase